MRPTGLFNAAPARGGPGSLAFPSDHTGVVATLSCVTGDADRAAVRRARVARATTTTTAPGVVDAAVRAAIEQAFEVVFGGGVTDVERKLSYLEDGERLRSFFVQRYEAVRDLAARVRVRIDDVVLTDPDHASVTYTLLLDGTPVLDHISGGAVRIGGRWLVTRRTFCDVSTQGASEIPEVCRG